MKATIIFLFLLGIIVSGCIENPLKQVPVVKVNITFVEKAGYMDVENFTFTQKTVDYAARPRDTRAETFPTISARTLMMKNNTNASVEANGPWANIPFKGQGTYSFTMGINEKFYPDPGDVVHISIIVVDEKGRRIGYLVRDMGWE